MNFHKHVKFIGDKMDLMPYVTLWLMWLAEAARATHIIAIAICNFEQHTFYFNERIHMEICLL